MSVKGLKKYIVQKLQGERFVTMKDLVCIARWTSARVDSFFDAIRELKEEGVLIEKDFFDKPGYFVYL